MARNTNGSGFSLKDELFNPTKVALLAEQLTVGVPAFNSVAFQEAVCVKLPELELKERIAHIADVLAVHLDADFAVASQQIVNSLPEPLDPTRTDDDFGSFIWAPFGLYVARHGCTENYVEIALATLKEITKRFSMEDAIRPFINTFPEETLAELVVWATDTNYHVRRLVSEGTRPFLPWSARLTVSYERMLPLLDTLHRDNTRYVTRSVANHLNDISKINPTAVLSLLHSWQAAKLQDTKELQWMSKHSLRTLVKQGHVDALAFLGYPSQPPIHVSSVTLKSTEVQVGNALHFSFEVTATKDTNLLIDYRIHFVKANGTTAHKVFKIGTHALTAGQQVSISKKHVFRKNATTFTFYAGEHTLELLLNGTVYLGATFTLVT